MSSDQYAQAKSVLKGEELAERDLTRDLKRLCDWDQPTDRAHHMSEARKRQRRADLRVLLGGKLRCPYCKRTRAKLSEWVILKKKHSTQRIAACRSCSTQAIEELDTEERRTQVGEIELFPSAEVRFAVDGFALARVRTICGLTLRSFSDLAGWSVSYQRKIEGPTRTISQENANVILRVLREQGFDTSDNLSAAIAEIAEAQDVE